MATEQQADANYRYEVRTRIGNGWENTWKVEQEVDGKMVRSAQTFDTYEQAKDELDEHQQDMKDADMDFNRRDFKIHRIKIK